MFLTTTLCSFLILFLRFLVSKGYLEIAIDVSIRMSHMNSKYEKNIRITININSLCLFYTRVFFWGGDRHKSFNLLRNCVNLKLLSAFGSTYPPLQLVPSSFPWIKSAGAWSKPFPPIVEVRNKRIHTFTDLDRATVTSWTYYCQAEATKYYMMEIFSSLALFTVSKIWADGQRCCELCLNHRLLRHSIAARCTLNMFRVPTSNNLAVLVLFWGETCFRITPALTSALPGSRVTVRVKRCSEDF